MIIVWDEPKRVSNLRKHGIDFADLDERFFDGATIGPAKHGRMFAIGRQRSDHHVIFVRLGVSGLSIVSARPASQKERTAIE